MASKMSGLSREYIIHPGETLRELLEERHMSQRELAVRTGVTEKHVSNVINCLKPISVSFAKKLEYALGIDGSFWINLQANYDKELADFEETNHISGEERAVANKLSRLVEYMRQLGMIQCESSDPSLVLELRRLLQVSSLISIPEVGQTGAYRLGRAVDADPYILFAWLRMCDLVVENQPVNRELDIGHLQERIPLIKELMYEESLNEIQARLSGLLEECGVRFALVEHCPGAPVQGVIKRHVDGTLSLVMTSRQKFADVFWFTLFHEIGHIVHGDVADKLVDFDELADERENKADQFAADVLIAPGDYENFVQAGDYSLERVKEFCSAQRIPPFVLIGRLQKEGYLGYHHYPEEKARYEAGV